MMDRWGKGSCTPNPEKTANSRETEDKLKKLIAERDRQDSYLQSNNNNLAVINHGANNLFKQK